MNTKFYMKVFIKYLRESGVNVGNPFYIDFTVWIDPTDFSLVTLEDEVVLARGTQVLVHDYSPRQGLIALGYELKYDYRCDRPVYIGYNSFVGINSILKPGTYLGAHCLVASGSVVSGRFEPYSIIAGNPAKVLGDVREWMAKKVSKMPEFLDSVVSNGSSQN